MCLRNDLLHSLRCAWTQPLADAVQTSSYRQNAAWKSELGGNNPQNVAFLFARVAVAVPLSVLRVQEYLFILQG